MRKCFFSKLAYWGFLGRKKPKSSQKTNQIWVWSVGKGDLKLPYIDCGNTVPEKRGHCKCGLSVTITKSPYSTSVYYKALLPKGWPCTLLPLLNQGDLFVVLFYVCHGTILLIFSNCKIYKIFFFLLPASKKLLATFWAVWRKYWAWQFSP